MTPRANLSAKSFVYEALVAKLLRRRDANPAQVVDDVERAANFAYEHHPGIFADGRVENVLLDLNNDVAKAEQSFAEVNCFGGQDRPRMLHVASEVFQAGGHSRVLAKWIDRDLASQHCVILTRQRDELPPLLASTCHQHGVKIIRLPLSASKLSRAATLRRLSRQANRVILHHHPDDAIPILAFAACGGPPVAYFNHAHFWFSLGGTVADITLNTLPYFVRLTERFRFPRAVALLSGVSGNRSFVRSDKDKAKRDLGLDPGFPVLLTIGSENYFRPGRGYDFFATLQKVLAACGTIQVLVLGVRPEADFVPPVVAQNERVRLLGPVADPVPYYQAADICLESFPHSSLGGFVEAVAYGAAFPIPAYAEGENILQVDLPPFPPVSPRPKNEAEYVKCIRARLADLPGACALACDLQNQLLAIDREWPAILRDVYGKIDVLSHTPGAIPAARCSFEQDNQLLAALKPFHLPGTLNPWLSYVERLKLNLKWALQGEGSVTGALAYEWRHLWSACLRRLRRA